MCVDQSPRSYFRTLLFAEVCYEPLRSSVYYRLRCRSLWFLMAMKFLSSAEKLANGVRFESLSFTIFEMRLIEVLSPIDC